MTVIDVPGLVLKSEANLRCHWSVRYRRFRAQKAQVKLSWPRRLSVKFPIVVTLVRIGPRRLDSDNLAGAGKGCRDQIAELLGVDDGDESKVRWAYEQEKGPYGLRIEIHELGESVKNGPCSWLRRSAIQCEGISRSRRSVPVRRSARLRSSSRWPRGSAGSGT